MFGQKNIVMVLFWLADEISIETNGSFSVGNLIKSIGSTHTFKNDKSSK